MGIEQHAEAAADEIDRSMTDGPNAIISKHMQSAIDEALAEKMISALDAASNHAHEVDLLRARIVELEGLGPLITEFGLHLEMFGRHGDKRHLNVATKAKNEINAILKGGAS